jgi:rod shape-determining protein MreD
MAISLRDFLQQLINRVPILLLFFVSLNGSSIIDFKIFSINILYILVYFWVLRKPESLGYGLIFLSGIITDVVHGFPIGSNALSLLIIAGVASYIRVVTVRITLINDWVSFIPALLITNLTFFITLVLSDYSISYFYLLQSSIFTFFFYPILWAAFSVLTRLMRS